MLVKVVINYKMLFFNLRMLICEGYFLSVFLYPPLFLFLLLVQLYKGGKEMVVCFSCAVHVLTIALGNCRHYGQMNEGKQGMSGGEGGGG